MLSRRPPKAQTRHPLHYVRRAWWCVPLAFVLVTYPSARAMSSLIEPERLTSGTGDQFLGALEPAGERLFFASNENATTQIFGVEMSLRVPEMLIDDAADATWPRVSPDGKKLLYISYRGAAVGELCLRDLPAHGLTLSDRHCFSLRGRAALQAVWMPDSRSILLVTRDGLAGEIEVRRLHVGESGMGEVVLKRDLSSPAVSTDGRWLLYVPITRQAGTAVSTSSGAALEIVRLDGDDRTPRQVKFELPGKTGFPAFSFDGHFVYFSQYLNDTNFDGNIDGNDHAVLFRVPFDGSRAEPIDVAHAEQLTSANWDCQYPFPGRDRLITTCLYEGSLDIFSLPLEGSIPAGWNREKLLEELVANRSQWEQLLVYSRLIELDTVPAERAFHLKRIIELHFRLHEYQSTSYYAKQLQKLAADQPGETWREEEGIATVLLELTRHRREEEALSLGQLNVEFEAAAHDRLAKLESLQQSPHPAVAALATLVMSEIQDTLGEKGEALSLLASVRTDAHTRPIVLHLLGDRARSLYPPLHERDLLLKIDLLLAQHPSLKESERIGYAQDYVRDLTRGHPFKDRPALLEAALKTLNPDSTPAFAVELEQALATLSPDTQQTVKAHVFDLWDRMSSFDRRRALVHTTVARASATDSELLWYDTASKWAEFVDQGHADRQRTERLYRQVALERAYIDWTRGNIESARQQFDTVTHHSSHLESHAGLIEASIRAGKTDIEAEYRKRYAGKPDDPALRYALAYIIARRIPEDRDLATMEKDVEAAVDHLKVAVRGAPNSAALHHLWGYIRHQRYLRTGDKHAALRANAHYLIALDLARDNPRYRAAILTALGFLQAHVGNYAMAIGFFEQREKMPFVRPEAELAECLMKAKSLLHADQEKKAAQETDRCVALVDATPSLAKYLPYALDRSALYHSATKDFDVALARYKRLQPLLERESSDETDNRRNFFVLYLGRAAVELGAHHPREALIDVDLAEQLLHKPAGIPLYRGVLQRRNSSGVFTQEGMADDYAVLFAGIRAQALASLGDIDGATKQMELRLAFLKKRSRNVDDDQKALALAEADLAHYAFRRGDMKAAAEHIEAGLHWADELEHTTNTPVHGVALTLLREYADLHFIGHVPLTELKADLPGRLTRLYTELCDRPNPRWTEMRSRYALYLNRLMLEGVRVKLW